MTHIDPNWMEMLRAEADRTSIGDAAIRIGYSRTAISLVLAGKYAGKTDKVAKAVSRVLATSVDCPYLGDHITSEACREKSLSRAPTHNPQAMGQWRACQRCPNKCKKGNEQ